MLALAVVLAPQAVAHGAPPPREIDLRLLTDTTDQGDYGTAAPLLYEGGHDLLALDLREGYAAELGEAVLVVRLINQAGDPTQGPLREVFMFDFGGVTHTFDFLTTDNVAYTSTTFERVTTLEIGDDHVTGAEGWIPFSRLGWEPGSEIHNLRVRGFVGEKRADEMPGLYWYQDQPMSTETAAHVMHTLQGAAVLLDATHDFDAPTWATRGPGASINLTVHNALTQLPQLVTVTVAAPRDVSVLPSSLSLLVEPGATARAPFTVDVPATLLGGALDWEVSSDVLGWSQARAHLPWDLARDTLPLDTDGAFGLAGGESIPPGGLYAFTFTTEDKFVYNSTLHLSLYGQVDVHKSPARPDGSLRLVFIDEADDGTLYVRDQETAGRSTRILNGTTVVWINRATQPVDIWSQPTAPRHEAGHDAPAPAAVWALGATIAGAAWAARRRAP